MKKSKDLTKIKEIISNDFIGGKDDFMELLKKDVFGVLKEYFEFSDNPFIRISKPDKNFKVEIGFSASKMKNFYSIPNIK